MMKALALLAWRSAWNRRGTLALVLLSIALATLLLLSFERVRTDVRENFSNAVSGTDLIVGARTGPVQLMLYAVFRVGGATNNIRMSSVAAIAQHRAVAWVVPLSLGDSHRGFPVLGTTKDYFTRFRYGEREPLVIAQGQAFSGELDGLYGAVLGAEVAQRLHYRLGDRLVLSHGSGAIAGSEHADKPFTVVGILARTGTPVDRTVHISLQAMEAIHLDWLGGAPLPGMAIPAEQARKFDLEPKQVTAALIGLKGRAAVFAVQRRVAEFEGEPLMAVLPGVALDELWDVVGLGEKALLGMSAMVALVSLAGLIATVLAGLNERRRELAVLRSVGAGPRHVLALLAVEGTLVTLGGVLLGCAATVVLIAGAGPWVQAHYGVALRLAAPTPSQWLLLGGVLAAGVLASLVPGLRAYRLSLADGLSPRT
jgi:putative ABC transport system permease protein